MSLLSHLDCRGTYARVSTDDQTLDLQRDALWAEGRERVFEDTARGAGERPALRDAFEQLRAGDTLVVWRLDRLGRSLKDLIERAETLRNRGVGLRSLKEAIDTDSSTGQLVFHIFGALAEFERALIRERTCSSSDTYGTQTTVVGECGTGRGEARAGAGSGSLQ